MHIQYHAMPRTCEYRFDFLIQHCLFAVAFFLPLSLNISSAFLGCGTLLWIGKMAVLRRLELRRTPFDIMIAVLVFLSALSVLMSPDREFSFYNYYQLMGRYIMIYYLTINNIHSLAQLKRLVCAILLSAAVVAAYGFYQYIHGVDISALEWVDGEQFPDLKMRVYSTMKNPNLLGGFLVMMMALSAGVGLKTEKMREKIVLFGLVAMLGICLVLTYSRGAWISGLAVFLAYGLFYNRKILWIPAVVFPLVVFGAHDLIMERLLSIFNPTDTSSTLRLALWESTLAMIADKPVLGIGWGAYWMVYPQYDFFMQNGTKIFHAHNMYLNIAAEIGIPGLGIFLAILYGHVRQAMTIFAGTANCWLSGLMLGVLAALLGLAVSGFTDYVMFNIQMSMLFWLCNALVVVAGREAGWHY